MVDTITAIATPEGHGALSIIRISGPHSLTTAQQIFKPLYTKDFSRDPWKLHSGHIIHANTTEPIDEALLVFFKAPRSYTGDDLIEITCHGSPIVAKAVLNNILLTGVRLAKPGEFTRRAFTNGRIDLSKAEAVAQMTATDSEASMKAALKLLQGGLSDPVKEIRKVILHILTSIELDLDFPEEVASIPEEDVKKFLLETERKLQNLIEAGNRGDVLTRTTDIVLAGRVNAGKSSLYNRLAGRSKAIVSDEPGTTRDALESSFEWDGCSITLIDTAGLRQTTSKAETEAVRRAYSILEHAQIILYVIDGTNPDIKLLEDVSNSVQNAEIIVFWNKIDISRSPSEIEQSDITRLSNVTTMFSGSAHKGMNVIQLRKYLIDVINSKIPDHSSLSLIISLRQKEALISASQNIKTAVKTFIAKAGPECVVPMLLAADRSLGEILGDTVSPDVLGEIFSTFCIGK